MKKTKYHSPEWKEFSDRVKKRDNYNCTKCNRSSDEVVLQVHHEEYISGKKSWDYPLSSCITLCKGCHAREHGLIQPSNDWILVSITDLGELDGKCERVNCGNDIRHQYKIYHPNYGYLNVGSTCVEYLTQEIAEKSRIILLIHAAIRNFLKKSWSKFPSISSYEDADLFFIKHSGYNLYLLRSKDECKVIIRNKNNSECLWFKEKIMSESIAKEMVYIVLRGLNSKKESEKKLLRDVYKGYQSSSSA